MHTSGQFHCLLDYFRIFSKHVHPWASFCKTLQHGKRWQRSAFDCPESHVCQRWEHHLCHALLPACPWYSSPWPRCLLALELQPCCPMLLHLLASHHSSLPTPRPVFLSVIQPQQYCSVELPIALPQKERRHLEINERSSSRGDL